MPDLKDIASLMRRDNLRMVHGANSGHPGGHWDAQITSLCCFNVMKHNPDFDMNAKGEDVFILSNGHISPFLG